MTDDQIQAHVERVRTVGYTVLRQQLPADLIGQIADAFRPVYESELDTIRTHPNRGPMRHYIQLPFAKPFYYSEVLADPDVIRIVQGVVGRTPSWFSMPRIPLPKAVCTRTGMAMCNICSRKSLSCVRHRPSAL